MAMGVLVSVSAFHTEFDSIDGLAMCNEWTSFVALARMDKPDVRSPVLCPPNAHVEPFPRIYPIVYIRKPRSLHWIQYHRFQVTPVNIAVSEPLPD